MNIGMVVRSEALFGEFKAKVVTSPIAIRSTAWYYKVYNTACIIVYHNI
jgi:hypothetical protein